MNLLDKNVKREYKGNMTLAEALAKVPNGTPVTRDLIYAMIGPHGQFFTVKFIKRTDGTLREMTCRLGVKKHLKGGELPYDQCEKHLICVFDTVKEDYRTIPIENLTYLKVHGTGFNILDGRFYREDAAIIIKRGEIVGIASL